MPTSATFWVLLINSPSATTVYHLNSGTGRWCGSLAQVQAAGPTHGQPASSLVGFGPVLPVKQMDANGTRQRQDSCNGGFFYGLRVLAHSEVAGKYFVRRTLALGTG